jgi:hypothetical protein
MKSAEDEDDEPMGFEQIVDLDKNNYIEEE